MTILMSPEAQGALPLLLAALAAGFASALRARRAALRPVRVPVSRRRTQIPSA
ncbi:hypothetical protein [Methylobacterium dankookense]|uniref:Uncharacterized protein n=1 Tax=Methylobacterium dankookense TaxID=560405 RepID=A0A564FYK3_9HYPH|nr:hypothetical protein [Methylobacterium dankookense]GJD59075.1 hypothetical protein IFDJLNFL_5002 [Methylobacterium dankookense]VUF13067.1 hypothetical protein MTDSW087_02765 [Methylobacterium dankookense]